MDAIKSISDALTRANQPIRPYFQKVVKSEFFIPEFARFRLVVYYKNKKQSRYPSFDYTEKDNGETIRDEWNGLYKLIRLGNEKLKNNPQVKSIAVYATTDKTPQTNESRYDTEIFLKTRFVERTNPAACFTHRNTFFMRP